MTTTTENSAVIKIVAQHTKEMTALLLEHNTLLKVHKKTVEDFSELDLKAYELRKQNKDLRDIIVRFEKDNKMLLESLDACQRALEEME